MKIQLLGTEEKLNYGKKFSQKSRETVLKYVRSQILSLI